MDIVIISDESFSNLNEGLNDIGIAEGFKPVIISNRGKIINSDDEDQLITQWFCRFKAIKTF